MRLSALLVCLVLIAGCAMELTEPAAQQGVVTEEVTTGLVIEETSKSSAEVRIVDLQFLPRTVEVSKGTEVIWTNLDNVSHTVTFDALPIDEHLPAGAQYSYLFTEAGEFEYGSRLHPRTIGTVLVE